MEHTGSRLSARSAIERQRDVPKLTLGSGLTVRKAARLAVYAATMIMMASPLVTWLGLGLGPGLGPGVGLGVGLGLW